MKRIALGITVAALCLVPALASPANAQTPAATPLAAGEAQPPVTSLLVRYEPGVAPADASGDATGAASVTTATVLPGEAIGFGLRTVDLAAPLSEAEAEAAAAELETSPDVAFAEPNYIVTLDTVQPSPTWGLDRIDQRALPVDSAYRYISTGAGVEAYVIDTGILTTHTEFTGRLAAGANFAGGAIGTSDCNGHGTHVAGTIGGTTYGVAKGATLVPVRVFDCAGSTLVSTIISGINWVVGDHVFLDPAVANLSLGVNGISTLLDAAIQTMIDDNITVVVAAGNDGVDSCTVSPSDVTNAITVNASDTTDKFSVWNATQSSNFGACSDLYAPGTGITSAWFTGNSATAVLSGTSMAAPHVAGVAARILDDTPSLTPAAVWGAIDGETTATAVGRGAPDPDKLLFISPGIATTPTEPRNVSAAPGDTTAAITWTAPLSDGGEAVTSYTATAYTALTGGASVASCTPAPATGLGCTITGLANATTYYVDVVATNPQGPGPASSPRVAVTPAGAAVAPGAPRNVAAVAGVGNAAISWIAPASNGGSAITSYTATAYTTLGGVVTVRTCTPVPATNLSCTLTPLTAGTQVFVDVVATNGVGAGPASSPRVPVTPVAAATAPGAPTGVGATAGDTTSLVSWTAPASDGGSTISNYTATAFSASSGGTAVTTCEPVLVTGTTCTLTGLTNGTPVFVSVVATNGIGSSAASAPRVTVTPVSGATAPGAPTGVGATAGDTTSVVTWAAPASNGGSAITGYTATAWSAASGGVVAKTCGPVLATTCTLTALTNGATVYVSVVATNGVGPGPASAPRVAVTPVAVGGGGGGGGGGSSGGSTGGSAGGDAGGGGGGGAASVPVTAPVASTSTPATTPPAAIPPAGPVVVLFYGPSAAGIIHPTVAQAANVRVYELPKKATTSRTKAPTVQRKVNRIVRLVVPGLSPSDRETVAMFLGGKWVTLGTVKTDATGRATLPAFRPTKVGTYTLRITDATGVARYVKVAVA